MNRCLSERALLRMYLHEETAAERCHVRLCADCTEHYDRLQEDLEKIGTVLTAPAPVRAMHRTLPARVPWMPVAVACATVMAVFLDVAWVRRSAPLPLAPRGDTVSSFASDLSDALFETADANGVRLSTFEAPYLEVALDEGQPCTREQFLDGDCSDQFSAVLIDSE